MKHTLRITSILIGMFIATQIIGLIVVNSYSPRTDSIFNETTGEYEQVNITPSLPYGLQPPELEPQVSLTSIVLAFIIAILLLFLLMKIKAALILRLWFFFVVVVAISLTLNSFLSLTPLKYVALVSLLIALPLAFYKIFKRNLLIHNLTELMIYPGIAAVFVPILSIWTAIILLIIISAYDAWAVWHSGIMQKMAKYQMNELKFFAGFFVPYIGKKDREKIKLIKSKYKNKKIPEKRGKKIQVNLAILGGGDVVFPIITAGVFMRVFGLIPAIFIVLGAALSLAFLFYISEKKKFYPAMPFITGGIFLALIIWRIFIF